MLSDRLSKQRILFTLILCFIFLSAYNVKSEAAWKRNSNGTYSYYKSDGTLAANQWIGKKYYVDKNGIRVTGCVKQISGALYGFSEKGVLCHGKTTIKKKTYYFHKKTGKASKNAWIKLKKNYYYFNSDCVMCKNMRVGNYYVDKNGKRIKSQWKGAVYYTSSGKAATGLLKVGKYYYYFNKKTNQKAVNKTITVNKKTYQFDKNGHGKIVTKSSIPSAKCSVNSHYYSDPAVTDEVLLASIIYCEAGNQSYAGQLAVGMVVMNRKYSSTFGNTIREVVYQSGQFTPAITGALGSCLRNYSKVNASSKKAAKEVLELYKDYKKGKRIYLELNKKQIDFTDYFYFWGKGASSSSSSRLVIGDHAFYKKYS